MSAADKAPDSDAGEKKSPKKLFLIIGAVALVVLLAGGFFVFKAMTASKEPEKDPTKEPGGMAVLDEQTLNLADGKFLKMKLSLQLSEAETLKVGEKGLAKYNGSMANDAAIDIYSKHTYPQLLKPETRTALQKELTKEVAERYEGKVLKVYFNTFVMQ